VKNLSLIMNGVLAVAVIVLYVLHFNGKSTGQTTAEEEAASASMGLPNIAYVNSDTLLEHYDFFKDKRVELEEKQKKLESEFQNRARGLENEIANFQQTANNMTMAQAKAVEEDLMRKRQNLMQYQQTLAGQLQQSEAEVSEALYDNLAQYLQEYGKEKDFKLVLTYTKGSGVLYASDSLDITQQVIAGLNEKYKNPAGTLPTDTTKADSTASK
jgi:outer membrane protein